MVSTVRGKLIIGMIISVIGVNIIFTAFISLFLENNLKNNIIEEMKNINKYSINTIKQNEVIEEDKWDTINSIRSVSNSYVAMADSSLNITCESNLIINEDEIKSILKESKNISSIIKFKKLKKLYCITYNYPIYLNDKFYCNLIIQKNYIDKYNEKTNLILIILLGQTIAALSVILVITIIIDKVTNPIKRLSSSMKNFIECKEEDDVIVASNDEVGELAETYNLMKNKLKNQMDIIVEEKEKVEKLQKSSREFFNNATHELKTPITSISLYAQLLKENDIKLLEEEFIYRASNRLVLETEKMKSLVDKILEVSKGDVNVNKVQTKFSLNKIVEEIIEDYEVRLQSSRLTVNANLNEINCLAVLDDMEQIITNLLDNAIKYSSGNIIDIRVYAENEAKVFEISNKCGEIPLTLRDRLLEPFVKYNTLKNIKNEVSSSGLGLYLCSELSKENGGEIQYAIEDDRITFKFSLLNIDYINSINK